METGTLRRWHDSYFRNLCKCDLQFKILFAQHRGFKALLQVQAIFNIRDIITNTKTVKWRVNFRKQANNNKLVLLNYRILHIIIKLLPVESLINTKSRPRQINYANNENGTICKLWRTYWRKKKANILKHSWNKRLKELRAIFFHRVTPTYTVFMALNKCRK